MAPEQAQGEAIDHRADLFSLGSVLYVMCSGRPPFRASTTLAVLKRVAEDDAAADPGDHPGGPRMAVCDHRPAARQEAGGPLRLGEGSGRPADSPPVGAARRRRRAGRRAPGAVRGRSPSGSAQMAVGGGGRVVDAGDRSGPDRGDRPDAPDRLAVSPGGVPPRRRRRAASPSPRSCRSHSLSRSTPSRPEPHRKPGPNVWARRSKSQTPSA